MQAADISVIIPVRNIEKEMEGILNSAATQAQELNLEFIVVDMGSQDATVAEALRLIHKMNINGCVLQNGDTTCAAALNTGIYQANGTYISFIFARRLYRDFLKGYYATALRTGADFVFGSLTETEAKSAERRSMSRMVKNSDGCSYMCQMMEGKLEVDISSLLLRREFLQENQLWFEPKCVFGYYEEFICRCLMRADVVAPSPTVLRRDTEHELHRGKQNPVGRQIFQRVEAIIRVKELAVCEHPSQKHLILDLKQQQLPEEVMQCVDVLLREGMSTGAIRKELRKLGYDRLLQMGAATSEKLRKRIFCWKFMPWNYKSKFLSE